MGLERIGSTNKIDDHDICACRIRGKQIFGLPPRRRERRETNGNDARLKNRRPLQRPSQGPRQEQRQIPGQKRNQRRPAEAGLDNVNCNTPAESEL